MSVVSRATLRLPAADLGPESPLPAFAGLQRLPDPAASPGLPADMRARMSYGRLQTALPYALQNSYRRGLRLRDVPAISITNGRLEALVLPELGGRVWSLRDLGANRDVVFTNSRLQFANFGLTGAWFAGGIEWNLGSTGHTATTCRPVSAGTVPSERGHILRIWEWERTRDLVFSVDLLLPHDRSLLLAFIRVRNPDSEAKPLYWWTNIAAPEEPGVRVVAPADRAWRTGYDGTIEAVAVPYSDDPETDVSYPLTASRSADYFFQVPPDRPAWIAAVQAEGRGLVQTSTAGLRGRKLFCWGATAGGNHWQEWLCGPASRYLEIQAGLAETQFEHLQLAGDAEISWAEAYGAVEAGSDSVSGRWPDSVEALDRRVSQLMGTEELEEWHRWWRGNLADRSPKQDFPGTGAGAAELLVRGQDPDGVPGAPFGAPRVDGFRHLVGLVRAGVVDHDQAGAEIFVPPITKRWAPVFDQVADGWWGQMMIAIRAHAEGDLGQARDHYEHSNRLQETPWAVRGLALLAGTHGDHETAAVCYRRALNQAASCLPLLLEATEHLLSVGSFAECLAMIDSAPEEIRQHGRVLLQRARAMVATGQTAPARRLLNTGVEIPDLREGETLEGVWRAAFGDRPLPYRYDFRMRPDLDR